MATYRFGYRKPIYQLNRSGEQQNDKVLLISLAKAKLE
jgi:hypothetical protein